MIINLSYYSLFTPNYIVTEKIPLYINNSAEGRIIIYNRHLKG